MGYVLIPELTKCLELWLCLVFSNSAFPFACRRLAQLQHQCSSIFSIWVICNGNGNNISTVTFGRTIFRVNGTSILSITLVIIKTSCGRWDVVVYGILLHAKANYEELDAYFVINCYMHGECLP